MNYNEYTPLALRTAKIFPTQRQNFEHCALGLITETGEFANEVKRQAIYGKPSTPEILAHMFEELYDSMWYIPLGFLSLNADPLELTEKEKEELRVQIPDLVSCSILLSVIAATVGSYAIMNRLEGNESEVIVFLSTMIFVIDHTALQLGLDPDEGRRQNIAKLKLRYPDKYSDQAAEARADKSGADHRNS
jgi:NTP pyrophosphatase (non-canonical NTP hydrolase)